MRRKTVGRYHSGWNRALYVLAAIALTACGDDADGDDGAKASGLPGELKLSSLSDEKRVEFCDWFESKLPSEETCSGNAPEGQERASCVEHFAQFGSCTVADVERCLDSASSSSCELPDTEACAAFQACQGGPPANDCPDGGFVCRSPEDIYATWKGNSQRWGTCWSWWPPGCHRCDGPAPSWSEAVAWCAQQHPEECGDHLCYPDGPGYLIPGL